MNRIHGSTLRALRLAALVLALLVFLAPVQAASAGPLTAPLGTPTPVLLDVEGAHDASVRTDGWIEFANLQDAATRIIFTSRDVDQLECRPDGENAVESRAGQFLLQPGARLQCRLEPGRYRYYALTQRANAVRKTRARLSVARWSGVEPVGPVAAAQPEQGGRAQ